MSVFLEYHEIHWVCQSDLDLGMERQLLQAPFHEYVLAYHKKSETVCPLCTHAPVSLLQSLCPAAHNLVH